MIKSYEMANLTRQKSGQPFDIWIDSAGQHGVNKHNEPRIKATNNGVTVIKIINMVISRQQKISFVNLVRQKS